MSEEEKESLEVDESPISFWIRLKIADSQNCCDYFSDWDSWKRGGISTTTHDFKALYMIS
jgi:hypothetical protein